MEEERIEIVPSLPLGRMAGNVPYATITQGMVGGAEHDLKGGKVFLTNVILCGQERFAWPSGSSDSSPLKHYGVLPIFFSRRQYDGTHP